MGSGECGDSEKPKEVHQEKPIPRLGIVSEDNSLSSLLPLGFLSYLMP